MKTVIMAGGLGKRVAGIDDSIPKPLLPILGKPVLEWEIECLVRQGYTNIILTVSYMADKIQSYFGDGSKLGCRISYFVEDKPLGNAGALYKLHRSKIIEGDFLLLNADSMFDVDFDRMVRFHKKNNALATLFTHPNNHPQDSGIIICERKTKNVVYGNLSLPIGGRSETVESPVVVQWLTKEDERPKWYKNRVNAGLHILNTEILNLTGIDAEGIDENHKVDLDRDVLKPMVSSGRIFAYDSPEYVKDMGTPERFAQVGFDLVSGRVSSRNLSENQKAVFIDRDGTINKYVGFLRDIDDFELLPGVAEAIRKINKSGYLCIVVSNQPVIARGEVTLEELEEIHKKMETLLGRRGAYIDAIYYCPHHPDRGFPGEIAEFKVVCGCRKPMPGMLYSAAQDYNIDLAQSWMVGDSDRDVEAGKSAGCKTVYITNGKENEKADISVGSVLEFVEYLEEYRS